MRIGTGALLIALACGATHAAEAQLLDALLPQGVPGYGTEPGVTVVSRARPDTEPPGIHAGAFLLHPSIAEAIGFDDNVLGGAARQGSAFVETQPSLLVGSGWSRDAIGLYVSADDRRDLEAAGQDRTDWTVSLGSAVDVGTDRLTLAAAHFSNHQDRTEQDALPTDRPVAFQVNDTRAAYAWNAGRWTLTPGLEASSWHYDPTTVLGVPVNQNYRDRNVLQGDMTAAYELAPLRSLLLVARGIGQHYTTPAAGQPRLDSTGMQLLAGLDYDAGAVWRLRLLAGAEHRAFAAFPAQTAAIAEAELAWQPTGMTTVALTLNRSIEDAAQEGVAGFTSTSARLTLDHELRRDVLLHVATGLQHADFPQTGARQDAYTFDAGATWLASRYVRLTATYDLTAQQGGAVSTLPASGLPLSGSYTRNQAMLTLRLAL
ncbi:MAG TPA: outer membrane beta-barrel protein [Acetobacteraceae bacterium]|jgi:hypothetical protein